MRRFWIFRSIGCFALLMSMISIAQAFHSKADGVFLLTPGGRLFVVAWYRGTCILYQQNVRTGALPGERIIVQTFSVDATGYRYRSSLNGIRESLNLGAARVIHGWESPEYGESTWSSVLIVVVPLWTWLVLAMPLLAIVLARQLKTRRRRTRGLCLVCGYDLRASPSRCPECGTLVDGSPADV